MSATFDRLTAPIAAALPDLTRVPPRRQIAAGLVISVVFHLLLFTGVAWLLPDRRRALEPEERSNQLEVEIVRQPEETAPAPLIAANQTLPAIDPNGLEKSEARPEQPKFQSDEDMVAGSERPGKGLEPLPTQDGADLPFVDFKTQTGDSTGKPKEVDNAGVSQPAPAAPPVSPLYKPKPLAKQYLEALERIAKSDTASTPLPAEPADPAPAPPSEPMVKPAAPPALEEVTVPKPDEIPISAKSSSTPTPAPAAPPLPMRIRPIPIAPIDPQPVPKEQQMARLVTPPPRPQPPKEAGFTPDLRKTRIEGSISNSGRPGVDALRTPLGVYRREVSKLIQSAWLQHTRNEMPSLALGTVRIRFYVTQSGRIEDLEVVSNDSNKSFVAVCEQSIREAQRDIKSPPADLGIMKDGRLELVFSFTLYDTH